MSGQVAFMQQLVAAFPELQDLYEAEVENNGEVLAHVIFGIGGGITDEVVSAYIEDSPEGLDWRRFLAFLDKHVGQGDKEVNVVIGTSFLWRLPWPTEPGYGLVDELPPRLHEMWSRIRPSG
ncbi:DUF7674 family protein [Hamadaea tsunoensis]|uniref:DUF7674 family protein n=1 Tax=Hamadaea tsunoensis TaxID=53368 RepID=UPI000427E18F|nr:hypothetical protein [Hamadaea tsunoensis]